MSVIGKIALTKVWRDMVASRGRIIMMVGAMTTAMIAFNAVIGAFGILSREMTATYVNTAPASATFDIPDGVSAQVLHDTRARPEVAAAVRRRSVQARYRALGSEEFGRAHLFVIDDFADMPIARVSHESGAWPPPLGAVVLERSSLHVFAAKVGDTMILRTPLGTPREVVVSGIAYEPALAPATTEQAIYAYVTAETLAWLGEEVVFDELRVLMAQDANDAAAIALASQALAAWLVERGVSVHTILVPPPNEHPHQRQFATVLGMFTAFAAMILLLTGVLTAALLQSLMARQRREIGVMKTVGATSRQVQGLYVVMVGSLALLSFLLSSGPGFLAARAWANGVARVLNLDLASLHVPLWAIALQAVLGISIPLIVTLPSLRRAARVRVVQAIHDHGVAADASRDALARMLGRLTRNRRLLAFAVQNSVRQRRRFLLTAGLLTAAGGLFTTSLNLAGSWDAFTDQVFARNHYDVEFVVRDFVNAEAVATMPEVLASEVWGAIAVAFSRPGKVDVQTTYPDGAHGSFSVIAAPLHSLMVERQLLAGRWLTPTDTNAVVLNQAVPGFGVDSLGQPIALSIAGRVHTFVVVGIMQEVAAAQAYLTPTTFTALASGPDATQRLRVRLKARTPEALRRDMAVVEKQLLDAGVRLEDVLPLGMVKNAVSGHFEVLVAALLLLAVLLAIVGMLGLGASMSADVIERMREFGVFRATGARPGQIRRIVWLEATVVGAASGMAAAVVALPLSLGVGSLIGKMGFGMPLPLTYSSYGMGAWFIVALLLSTLASLLPARAAALLTVREALSHV